MAQVAGGIKAGYKRSGMPKMTASARRRRFLLLAGSAGAFGLGVGRSLSVSADDVIRSSVPSPVSLRRIVRIPLETDRGSGSIRSVAWSPDSRRVALVLGWGYDILVLDTSTWREVSRLKWRTFQPERQVAFLSNSEIVTSPADNEVDSPSALAVYDSEIGRLIREIPRPPIFGRAHTDTIVVTSTKKYIAMIADGMRPTPLIFEASSGRFMDRLAAPPDAWTRALAAGPENKLAARVGYTLERAKSEVRKEIYLFDAASNTVDRILAGHIPDVGSIAWSPDGRLIASGNSMLEGKGDRSLGIRNWIRDTDPIRIWDVATGEMVASFVGFYDPISRIAWHPSNAVIATDSAKGGDKELGSAVRLWSVTRTEILFEYKAPGAGIISGVSFHPGTGQLIWGWDNALYLFDVLGLP